MVFSVQERGKSNGNKNSSNPFSIIYIISIFRRISSKKFRKRRVLKWGFMGAFEEIHRILWVESGVDESGVEWVYIYYPHLYYFSISLPL